MKKLSFSVSDVEHYALIYEALLSSGGIKAVEARLFHKLMSKLEEAGVATEEFPYFKLSLLKNTEVILEDAEHALMKRLLDAVEFTANGARKAAQTFNWLDKQA